MSDLAGLIAKLEAAPAGSRDLDATIALFLGHPATVTIGDGVITEERHIPYNSKHFTTSIDAALTLVPPNQPNGMRCRVILERKPTQDADWWIAEVRHHAQNGGEAVAKSAALALCIAALKARSAA